MHATLLSPELTPILEALAKGYNAAVAAHGAGSVHSVAEAAAQHLLDKHAETTEDL